MFPILLGSIWSAAPQRHRYWGGLLRAGPWSKVKAEILPQQFQRRRCSTSPRYGGSYHWSSGTSVWSPGRGAPQNAAAENVHALNGAERATCKKGREAQKCVCRARLQSRKARAPAGDIGAVLGRESDVADQSSGPDKNWKQYTCEKIVSGQSFAIPRTYRTHPLTFPETVVPDVCDSEHRRRTPSTPLLLNGSLSHPMRNPTSFILSEGA